MVRVRFPRRCGPSARDFSPYRYCVRETTPRQHVPKQNEAFDFGRVFYFLFGIDNERYVIG